MKTQKQNYLSPVTETLVVRFEGVVCQSPNDEAGMAGAFELYNAYDEDF